MVTSRLNKDIITIPDAKISVDLKKSKHNTQICGTKSQRLAAKSLIKEILQKIPPPDRGFSILGLDDDFDVKKSKFRFIKFMGDDTNEHSQNKDLYYLELIKEEKEEKKEKIKIYDNLANQLRHGLELPSLKNVDFTTMDKFNDCLEIISEQVSKANPTNFNRKEIRLNIFIGQELFIKSDIVRRDKMIDSYDWCGFKRGRGGISTSFQHNSLQIIENMEIIQKKFRLKVRKEDENIENDKRSISVFYKDHRSKKGKLKLHWFEEEGLWKITRVAKDIRRNGTNMPDLRFLLKTQYDVPIDGDLKKLIRNIQKNKPLVLRDGLWFRMEDFKDNELDNFKCTGIRQRFKKKVYLNKKFQVSVVATRQEKDLHKRIAVEEYISVKSLDWRAVENIDKKPSLHFDEEEIHKTVKNTINFAIKKRQQDKNRDCERNSNKTRIAITRGTRTL
ncbi:11417_t:CDS:2, partial [Diversispora eburnea]